MDADSVKGRFQEILIIDIPTFFVLYCRSGCSDIDDFDEVVVWVLKLSINNGLLNEYPCAMIEFIYIVFNYSQKSTHVPGFQSHSSL